MKYLHVDLCGISEYYKNRGIDHYMFFHSLAGYLLNLPFKILCKLQIVVISIYFMLPTTLTIMLNCLSYIHYVQYPILFISAYHYSDECINYSGKLLAYYIINYKKNTLKFIKSTISVRIVTLYLNFMDENCHLRVVKENNFLVCHLLCFMFNHLKHNLKVVQDCITCCYKHVIIHVDLLLSCNAYKLNPFRCLIYIHVCKHIVGYSNIYNTNI